MTIICCNNALKSFRLYITSSDSPDEWMWLGIHGEAGGKSHCKEIEDTPSRATSSWHGSTDLHGEQDSTAVVRNPGCTLQSARGAPKQTPTSGPHVQEFLINSSGGRV